MALARSGNTTGAIGLFDRALAIDPNYFKAILFKGITLASTGDYPSAIELYDRALTIDPDRLDVLDLKASQLRNNSNSTQGGEQLGGNNTGIAALVQNSSLRI